MQHAHPFHPELRHATFPTYFASYAFPALIVIYEIYRVGYWVAHHGMNFITFNQAGFEYVLMLAVFAVQVAVEVLFLGFAWMSRHPDLGHRLTNLALGLVCSGAVLGFDYFVLQASS
jgi:hypothetical protein